MNLYLRSIKKQSSLRERKYKQRIQLTRSAILNEIDILFLASGWHIIIVRLTCFVEYIIKLNLTSKNNQEITFHAKNVT